MGILVRFFSFFFRIVFRFLDVFCRGYFFGEVRRVEGSVFWVEVGRFISWFGLDVFLDLFFW